MSYDATMRSEPRVGRAKIDFRALRDALGAFATGVTVITARGSDQRDVGVTANSFNSVSLDPPLVLWSLNRSSRSLEAFISTGYFAVHVLAANQKDLSMRFASRDADRFAGLQFKRGCGGAPLLPDCAARFQCRLASVHDGGDHVILVGEVLEFEDSDRTPLIFHRGRYLEVPEVADAASAAEGIGDAELTYLVSSAHHKLYRDVRREFIRRQLSEACYYALRVLGARGRERFEVVAQWVMRTGRELTREEMEELHSRSLVQRDDEGLYALTALGRRTMAELAAIRFSAEQAILSGFHARDIALLKGLLRGLLEKHESTTTPSSM